MESDSCIGVKVLAPSAFAPLDWMKADFLFRRNDEISITEVRWLMSFAFSLSNSISVVNRVPQIDFVILINNCDI